MTPMAIAYVFSVAIAMLAILIAAAVVSSRKQHVVCPDNGRLVDVTCGATSATKTLFTGGHLRVTGCERWPEMAGCDRACENQLPR